MSYTICHIDTMLLNSKLNDRIESLSYQNHQYDLAYMIQRYSLHLDSLTWLIQQMNLTGNEVALELGCFSKSYCIQDLKYAHLFKNLYVVDKKIDRLLPIKRMIKRFSPENVEFHHSDKLEIKNQTVDIIYSSNLALRQDKFDLKLLLDSFHSLKKDEGTFYYIDIIEDYYASLYRLLLEYDKDLPLYSRLSKHLTVSDFDFKQFLNQNFSVIEENDYQDQLLVDNVDDLIGFILSDSEFNDIKGQLFSRGISKFRIFLQNKIDKLGGVMILRNVRLISCKQKRVYS